MRSKKKRKVTFDDNIKVLNMHAWKFAYSEARKSNFQQIAADRFRFKRRIDEFNVIISPILTEEHRKKTISKLNL